MDAYYPLIIIVSIVIALVIGWAGRDLKQRLEDDEKYKAKLMDKIKKLEDANNYRMSIETQQALENEQAQYIWIRQALDEINGRLDTGEMYNRKARNPKK